MSDNSSFLFHAIEQVAKTRSHQYGHLSEDDYALLQMVIQ